VSFEPIAILGRGCVLPGALTPHALWQLVLDRRGALSPAPTSLWGLAPGTDRAALARETLHDIGGYVIGFDRVFSPDGFRIPVDPDLDPVFLWTLHAAREALRDSGRDADAPVRGAVILGNLSYPTPGLVRFALEVWGKKTPRRAQDRLMSGLPAALVARAIGFEGPAFALDAACASSLYAIKLACDHLAEGRADLAVAGGVNHADDLFLHLGFTALAALSPSGRSRPFHREADGLVPAQGAAVVLLKRLCDAVRDGDRIRAVIRGIGLSNDGRSRGLLVPSEDGQVRAMMQAYETSGLSPSDISLVECHATGTAIGDAVEARSLKAVFAGASDVPIGSLKSNLGHLITASGAAGVLKVLAAMESELRPATLHAEAALAEVNGPLRLLRDTELWPGDRPRRAAVSSFGFGGNNAHVVLEEWRPESRVFHVPNQAPPAAGSEPIAVIAMTVHAGSADTTEAFETALFSDPPQAAPTIETFLVDLAGLRFPPADLHEAIPQQMLLLRAAQALRDRLSALPPRTSVLVGMQCDAVVARPSVRWRRTRPTSGHGTDKPLSDKPLTAAATVGCMPNMVANRLNQQIGAAAPSYAVSAEEASGAVALALAMRDLATRAIDAAVVAAVDLSGEPVQRAAAEATQPEGRRTPGDAAIMLVLKRLEDARRDNDRVLALLSEPTEPAPPHTLDLDGTSDGLSWLFGHAHAASGLLHVAAAIAACRRRALLPTPSRAAMPWLPVAGERRLRVRIRATGGTATECDVIATPSTDTSNGELAVFAAEDRDGLLQALASYGGASGSTSGRIRVAVVAPDAETLSVRIRRAADFLSDNPAIRAGELTEGIYFGQGALKGEVACVFGGPAGAYPGMARDLLLGRPEIVDAVHARMLRLREAAGWLYERDGSVAASPEEKLWGSSFLIQAHAELTLRVLRIRPHASIGYCSGETNALFALGAWTDMDGFRDEIAARGVYSRELAGELRCLRRAWSLASDEPVRFTTLRVRTPLPRLREALRGEPRAHLAIVHGADDAVIAGEVASCERVAARVGAGAARPLGYDFVMHCPEARVFAEEWRALHRRPTRPVPGVRFYTHATLASYTPTDDDAADALLGQAMGPIDFPALIERAYADGVRVFIEHGPHAACTRWIDDVLGDRPHLAVALDRFGRSSLAQATESVARLFAAGVPLDPSSFLSGRPAPVVSATASRHALDVAAHLEPVGLPEAEVQFMPAPPAVAVPLAEDPFATPLNPLAAHHQDLAALHVSFLQRLAQSHNQFLDLLGRLVPTAGAPPLAAEKPGPRLDRAALEAIASGPLAPVLGPLFAEQDRFRRVVRMPEPPLLLADRVLGIEGEPCSMGLGTIWTETDVTADAWYLHEGRMPAGLVVEAGQADLLLISWLGIDRLNRGKRVYRLLGCDLTLYGELPRPGDTLAYEIHVDGHAQQGAVRLFFFHYDCRVSGELRMRVRNGQAGFFTDEELAGSGGVLYEAEDVRPTPSARLAPPVVASSKPALSAAEIAAFTEGRIADCFGAGYNQAQSHTRTPTIPGGRLRLIDEVTHFDPAGGPWGRGYLRATLALTPDSWFYQGHFKDDPCMPGTLMLEGSLQAMSIYLAALGFTLDRDGFIFMPVPDEEYRLRCRGQATPASKQLVYEIFVDELVDGPAPTLFADLLGTVDGVKAFHCRRMGLRLVAAYPLEIGRVAHLPAPQTCPAPMVDGFAFDARSVLACAWGRPSEAFGPMYERFDGGKNVPRLPGPPYLFISRVVAVSGTQGAMQIGSEVQVEYDVPEDAWYFDENGSPQMPFNAISEIALQPCGWIASYAGCAVSTDEELAFRNLDGTGTVHREVTPDMGTLSTTSRLTSVSRAGGIIIVGFDVEVRCDAGPVFSCQTVFGFFTAAAMRDQLGLPAPALDRPAVQPFPLDAITRPGGPLLPHGRLRMIDAVESLWPEGGPAGLGRIVAKRTVSPADWYFRAHFFRDPVQPGSLGLEAMIQALKILAVGCGLTDGLQAPRFQSLAAGQTITWRYRGQVLPENDGIAVDLAITKREHTPDGPVVTAEGTLSVDGKPIYQATGLSLRIVDEADVGAAESQVTRLFAVTGASPDELLEDLAALERDIRAGHPLPVLCDKRLARLSSDPSLVGVLIAHSTEELLQETRWAATGISRAVSDGRPFKTPAGSYFAPMPLGRDGKVAFIYPGMGSARPGIGARLFARFPNARRAMESLAEVSSDLLPAQAPTSDTSAEPFASNARNVSRASMVLSFLYTRLLRDDFAVTPHMAAGFSIGEGSMFAALSTWPEPHLLEERLASSPVFSERLSGPMTAAREHVGVEPDAPFAWRAVIVRATANTVRAAIAEEPGVFLLTIHTPDEVMIAGEADACTRVVAALGVPHLPAPFQLVMHCPPALTERDHLEVLHRLPVAPVPEIAFYSAAADGPVPQASAEIAEVLARSYTSTVDFPRLVRRLHQDGGRIFVELGAQSSCSRWIERILDGQPYACAPIHAVGIDEEAALLRGMAVLLSHRVPLDPAPLRRFIPLVHAAPSTEPQPAPRVESPPHDAAHEWEELLLREVAPLVSATDSAQIPRDQPLPLDSLAVLELRARLEATHRLTLTPELFLHHRTVRSLAAALAALPSADTATRPHLQTSARYTGSWGQSDMWHLPRQLPSPVTPEEFHRTIPLLWTRSRIEISGPLDVDLLRRAVRDTFARHDILRSVVRHAPGRPLVERLPDWLPDVEVEEGIDSAPDRFFARPLDPAAGPPARVAIFRRDALSYEIALHQHHLFTDGFSLGLFWNEVISRYQDAPLSPAAPSFEEYCRATDAWLASADSEPSRAYWRETLRDVKPVALPLDTRRTGPCDFVGGRLDLEIDAALVSRLDALCRRESVGMFSVLLWALAEALHEEVAQEDILLSTFHANRSLPGFLRLLDVMGPVFQGVFFRCPTGRAAPRSQRLRTIHRVATEALAHGAVPIPFMRAELGLALPAQQVCLLYQSFASTAPMKRGPLTMRASEPVGFGAGQASWELELVLWPVGGGLQGMAAYATQVFRQATVERIVRRFTAALASLTE
jgi:PfaB family protein